MITDWNKQWNALGSDEKRKIARSAGFSESESALLSKLYWEGFPIFIITQLQSVEWAEKRCPTCGSTDQKTLGTQLAYVSYEQGSVQVPCRHEWHREST
jgi:hypothetical protein